MAMSQALSDAQARLHRAYDVCNGWAVGEPQKCTFEEASDERLAAHGAFLSVIRSETLTVLVDVVRDNPDPYQHWLDPNHPGYVPGLAEALAEDGACPPT